MPKRSRRRQNRNQPQRPTSRWSFSEWIKKPKVRVLGISSIVIILVAGLIAAALSETAANDFELTMYQGADVVGAEELAFSSMFPAEKPVVLNFWAGLCPPCRAEMPGFQRVYNEYEDEFILLGLDVGPFRNLGSNQDALNLLQELNITYPAGYAHTRDAVGQYHVITMPTTVFFTPDGQVFQRSEGFINEDSLGRTIENLLADSLDTPSTS